MVFQLDLSHLPLSWILNLLNISLGLTVFKLEDEEFCFLYFLVSQIDTEMNVQGI